MTKLHELLAAEKTPTGAWNTLQEDTLKKFKNPDHFYHGHSKSLSMIEDTPANKAEEDKSREDKPVPTTVYDTLEYALGIFARAEDLQYQKNSTNRVATGTVMWQGSPLLVDLPVDELLGLEARVQKIRGMVEAAPTLDATKNWVPAKQLGRHVWELAAPEKATKTEKVMVPVIMAPATDKHPAQVQAVTKDNVVGTFSIMKRSGACTAVQKSDALTQIDNLLIEIKQARMRANETEATTDRIAAKIVAVILEPLGKA
jgi:hypothetical protein